MSGVSIFEYDDYKEYVHGRISSMPRQGYGEMAKIADHLRMHPTRVSQVFKGNVDLSPEQACDLARYFGLSALEAEYLVTLVQLGRAGSRDLKAMIKSQLEQLKERAKHLVHRVPKEKTLSEEQKAIFYSSWYFSGIRLATSVDGLNSIDSLAEHFQMSREKIRMVIDFLLASGLCIENEGRLTMGPKTTHLEQSSPLVLRHHTNWRLKAITRHEVLGEDELAYTCPVSIRKEDMAVIREMLSKLIEKFLKEVTASDPPDTLACLNIDWVKVQS